MADAPFVNVFARASVAEIVVVVELPDNDEFVVVSVSELNPNIALLLRPPSRRHTSPINSVVFLPSQLHIGDDNPQRNEGRIVTDALEIVLNDEGMRYSLQRNVRVEDILS